MESARICAHNDAENIISFYTSLSFFTPATEVRNRDRNIVGSDCSGKGVSRKCRGERSMERELTTNKEAIRRSKTNAKRLNVVPKMPEKQFDFLNHSIFSTN